MFSPGQALLSIGGKIIGGKIIGDKLFVARLFVAVKIWDSIIFKGLHGTATVAMAYLILDLWDCGLYW